MMQLLVDSLNSGSMLEVFGAMIFIISFAGFAVFVLAGILFFLKGHR